MTEHYWPAACSERDSNIVRLRDACGLCLERVPLVDVRLGLRVLNESNQRNRWATAKRAKEQRAAACAALTGRIAQGWPGLVVLITRHYSGRQRRFDDDGAWRATKAVQDGVADSLGVDDSDRRIVWVPTQQQRGGETCVQIQVWEREP